MRAVPRLSFPVRLVAVTAMLLGCVLGTGSVTTAQTVTPAAPVVTVLAAATNLGKPALRVQWTIPTGVVNFVVVRNREQENDPLFKAFGILPPGQSAVLDEDVTPGQEYKYRVCAQFSGPDQRCSGWVAQTVPAQGGGGVQGGGGGGPAPIIRSHTAYQSEIEIHWETSPSTYYNYYSIRYREKSAPAVAASYQTIKLDDDGDSGNHTIRNLRTGSVYMFSVTGCGPTDCYNNWGPEYEAATAPLGNIGERPAPVINATDAADTSITVSWDIPYKDPAHPNYAQIVVSYREKAGGPEKKEVQDGNWSNYTIVGLKPGTTYVIYVYGCNTNLGFANTQPGADCAPQSAPVEVTTKTVTFTTTPLIPALLELGQPIVTAGNSVKVSGSAFRTTGAVKLTLVGGGKSVDIGSSTINTGAFSTNVTVPAGTAAGKYKIRAQATPPAGQAANGTTQAEAEIEVVAPSKQGILTATSGGLVYTRLAIDDPFTLNGVNFAPGPIAFYVDSTSGLRIGSATVAANGTFKTDITVQSPKGRSVLGAHKIVAVQNDAVVGELAVTFELQEVIH